MKKTLIAGLALAAGLLGSAVHAVDIAFDNLHLEQGFNFRSPVPDSFGFITSLQLNGTSAAGTLKPDLAVKAPGGVSTNVVGVLQSFKWSAGLTDTKDALS